MDVVSWCARWSTVDELDINLSLGANQVVIKADRPLVAVLVDRFQEAINDGADRVPLLMKQFKHPLFISREEVHKLVDCLGNLLRLGLFGQPVNGYASDGVTIMRESMVTVRSPGTRWV